ncbi:MAG TPA: zinc ribbon domain-containing protein [Ktedonobacteraceae bacterium]
MNKLLHLAKKNLTVLLNAGSIIGTTAVTSILGFAYWVVAARLFPDSAQGIADTMISMMALLGTMSMMGLGTLLTGELTRQPGKEWALLNAALLFTGGVGVVVGALFALLAPIISPRLNLVGQNIVTIVIFALGVGLTALTMVLDQAMIGILRGGLQLGRNTVFSIVKLAVLFVCAYFFKGTAMLIYTTWLIGNVASLAILLVQRSKKAVVIKTHEEIVSGPLSTSGTLTSSGPLNLAGPLNTIERSIQLPCPDCGILSLNSASFCLNCGYPFSPTVEISSVRPQLLFDYGVIGVSESALLRKRKNLSGNLCPKCDKVSEDHALYCTSCGFPLTPTVEIPRIKVNRSKLDIEAVDTMPLLAAVKRENARQALSAESTQLLVNAVQDIQKPMALKHTPRPIEDAETIDMSNFARIPHSGENIKQPNRLDLKRSALFLENEKNLDLSHLPETPRPQADQKNEKHSIKPQWDLLRKLGGVAVQHHIVNLILLAPSQLLPLLVTVLLSDKMTAYFYNSFMLANFIFSLTYSLTTALHAVSSAQPAILAQKIRFTFSLSLIASVGANLVLQVGANLLLNIFNPAYAANASGCLRVLALAVFPIIIKSHYLAICRVYDRSKQIIAPTAIGTILELGLAVVGARMDGLLGLSLGWLIALVLEAFYMSRTVYKAAYPVNVNTMIAKKLAKS